jgi:hypothetical protein
LALCENFSKCGTVNNKSNLISKVDFTCLMTLRFPLQPTLPGLTSLLFEREATLGDAKDELVAARKKVKKD